MFKKIVNEYMDKNEDVMSSDEVIHEMNGIVLTKTADDLFDLNGTAVDDVVMYCKSQGYNNIDKIVFLTSYDIEFSNGERSVEKKGSNTLVVTRRNHMESNSKISILDMDGEIVVRVFMGSSISLDKRL